MYKQAVCKLFAYVIPVDENEFARTCLFTPLRNVSCDEVEKPVPDMMVKYTLLSLNEAVISSGGRTAITLSYYSRIFEEIILQAVLFVASNVKFYVRNHTGSGSRKVVYHLELKN